MLQIEHRGFAYAKPVFEPAPPRSATYEQALELLGGIHEPTVSGPSSSFSLGDSGTTTLDEFAARYVDLRDHLAFKRLRGEPLSARQELTLRLLNAVLERLLPEPAHLPPEVLGVVQSVLAGRSGTDGRR